MRQERAIAPAASDEPWIDMTLPLRAAGVVRVYLHRLVSRAGLR